ncbi:unnamed protein product [Gadus morhua 'NCC']
MVGASPTIREITIDIENATQAYCLINPRFHLTRGGCLKTLPIELYPATRDGAVFAKKMSTATGCSGVFTYDLSLNGAYSAKKMAVMFSVPFDFNIYDNYLAVGVFDNNKLCDEQLFNEMYNLNSLEFEKGKAADGILRYEYSNVVIMASMSDSFVPFLRLKVKQT